ncbi:MAG: sigma-70 family RNA polymerase sigma factor [Elusimicrobia bacterium]|nr:sigma-70 family RNA polymerase sigma factor [Elusimicrobiota bacterium]
MSEPSLAALKARDPEALAALVDDNMPRLLNGALGAGLSRADAEDAVAETFAAFFGQLERFEGRSSLRTYLFGILYHKAHHIRAKAAREQGHDDIEAVFEARFKEDGTWGRPPKGPEGEALDAEARRLIADCSEKLPEAQKSAFFLKESERLETEEVCNILGVSGTNLRVMLHRARLRLRECLERAWEAGS